MKSCRTDANQVEIVAALRQIGAKVYVASSFGQGYPDLVCMYQGVIHLVEVKDGSKPASARKLTPDQVKFHAEWACPALHVVNNVDEAIAAVQGKG